MNDELHGRHECVYPDCALTARTTPMALRVPGEDESHVVRFCARHELLFATGDPEVTEWVAGAPSGADGETFALA